MNATINATMNATYTKYELLRLIRNKRAFIFSLVFPLALYLLIAGPNKGTIPDLSVSIDFRTFYMVSMAGYGAMIAAISAGARIAVERSTGWNRQLRLTPLPVASYFRTKVVTSYVMALTSVALLFGAGLLYGVRISPFSRWLEMTGLLIVGILPFVAMGVLVGHLLTSDSMGPAIGGGSAFFGFLGGMWYPLPEHGTLHIIGQCIPSYWLTRASRVGIGAPGWGVAGWIVIGAWSVTMAVLAGWAYRRDTHRV